MRHKKGVKTMCDVAKLRGKMTECGESQDTLSKKVGMDRSTLNRKLKTGESFTIGEVKKIVAALKLTAEETMKIFFSEIVA